MRSAERSGRCNTWCERATAAGLRAPGVRWAWSHRNPREDRAGLHSRHSSDPDRSRAAGSVQFGGAAALAFQVQPNGRHPSGPPARASGIAVL